MSRKKDMIDYEALVQERLLEVVRFALRETEKNGLLEPHYFYISFMTQFPGVDVPDFLKDSHPDEITIVLQYQFWDLKVKENGFSVVLSFDDTPYPMFIPFDALLSFVDPGVKFGLHFTPVMPDDDNGKKNKPSPQQGGDDESRVISLDSFRKK